MAKKQVQVIIPEGATEGVIIFKAMIFGGPRIEWGETVYKIHFNGFCPIHKNQWVVGIPISEEIDRSQIKTVDVDIVQHYCDDCEEKYDIIYF